VYGKDNIKNYLEKAASRDNIIAYNKEKTDKLFTVISANSPISASAICFDNSISYTTENVKYPERNKSEEIHDITVLANETSPELKAKLENSPVGNKSADDQLSFFTTAKAVQDNSQEKELSEKENKLIEVNRQLTEAEITEESEVQPDKIEAENVILEEKKTQLTTGLER